MSRDPASARAALLGAGAWFAELVEELRPHHWTRPGLGSWDVRALVGHTHRALVTLGDYLLVPAEDETCTGVAQYYALAAAAADPAQVATRGVAAGRDLGRHPGAAVRASLDRAQDALAQVPLEEDPLIRTVVGGTRLRAYVPTRTFELAVHGLDVAAACGLDRSPPEHVLADAGQTVLEIAAGGGHLPGILLALTGRRPLPPGFSVLA
ncbi:maleylpyruvate isomerase family mycothiol-dependent enzyme [Kocuria sp. M1N1S27]|uniref:maleylpyruvate isomerase family mycothiol-dependent enzyme n=1 Tax=Kocuria kalidii TaxID=3376283 RepID=UPI00379CA9A4